MALGDLYSFFVILSQLVRSVRKNHPYRIYLDLAPWNLHEQC